MKSEEPGKALLTVSDLAQILNCGKTKARELINNRQIETVRIGRLVRLEREAVEEFIGRNRR